MKTAIFNFFVLQAVVWALVFSGGEVGDSEQVQYASLTDTWEVAQLSENGKNEVFAHYPSFNKLTLNINGTFVRLRDDETLEEGSWTINPEKTKLSLFTESGVQKFDIVELPSSDSESFIIKEDLVEANSKSNIKYELTRL